MDSRNATLTLRTSAAGNFHAAESLTFPSQASVESGGRTHCMQTVPEGACNECHTIPSQGILGAATAGREGDVNQRELATAHLALGYFTMACVLAGVSALVF